MSGTLQMMTFDTQELCDAAVAWLTANQPLSVPHPPKLALMIEFDSMDDAVAFYNANAELISHE